VLSAPGVISSDPNPRVERRTWSTAGKMILK
jgi:hypothetical protein